MSFIWPSHGIKHGTTITELTANRSYIEVASGTLFVDTNILCLSLIKNINIKSKSIYKPKCQQAEEK